MSHTDFTRCLYQAALERQDLSCMHLAHHDLESVLIIIIMYQIPAGSPHQVRAGPQRHGEQDRHAGTERHWCEGGRGLG